MVVASQGIPVGVGKSEAYGNRKTQCCQANHCARLHVFVNRRSTFLAPGRRHGRLFDDVRRARYAPVNEVQLRALMEQVARAEIGPVEAAAVLSRLPFEDLGFAKVDHHRELRQGTPEVVFGEGKSSEQMVCIAQSIVARGQSLLVTRVTEEQGAALTSAIAGAEYHASARAVSRVFPHAFSYLGHVALVAAGTSDLPVAEEAALTLRCFGASCVRFSDVGVAGIHRLLACVDDIRKARVVIVVAGMEGALPSVVGGLISTPLIAVPTSIGYGVAHRGLAALLGMLSSCASGITVVNIDNGFGAAMAALRILRRPDDESGGC
jgi:pyridinium-3,5-biscarboxylic acid mononucleotide synthase